MTRRSDFDRTLEAYFSDGPILMPDALFDAVLDQVERVPQRRLARLQLRFSDMSNTARMAAAAAAAVLVIGVGVATLGRSSDPGPGGPSPSVSPSASASMLPEVLQHPFLGAFRSDPPAPASQDRSILVFTASTFAYNGNLLGSSASAPSADRVRLVSDSVAGGCAVGDVGTYGWSSTPGAKKVMFTLIEDACVQRAAVIPGEWLSSDCDNADNFCLGKLEAGSYSSFFFDPWTTAGGAWRPRFGAVTYEVPAGWASHEDWPHAYGLRPQSAPVDASIHLWSDIVIVSESDPCSQAPEPTVERTARAMTDWLTSAPGIVATEPAAVSIGGLSGWRLDIAMDPTWTTVCSFSEGQPSRGLFTDSEPGEGLHSTLGADTRMRLYVLDLGDGRTLVIHVEAQDAATFDGMVEEATSIVESMVFTR